MGALHSLTPTGMMTGGIMNLGKNLIPGIERPDTKFDTFLKGVCSFLFIIFWVIVHIYASLKGKVNKIFAFVVPVIVIVLYLVSRYVKQIREMLGIHP